MFFKWSVFNRAGLKMLHLQPNSWAKVDFLMLLSSSSSLQPVVLILNIREKLFTARVFKHWNRLPREVLDAPRLSVSKRHLDNVLNDILQLLVSPEVLR